MILAARLSCVIYTLLLIPFSALSSSIPEDYHQKQLPTLTSTTSSCFPALGFIPPTLGGLTTPSIPHGQWWCNPVDERGFLGFSYAVDACQSPSTLLKDFKRMRTQFNARYVRLYAWCIRKGFLDDVIKAGYEAGIGVYAVIWFGFDANPPWEHRRDSLLNSIKTNPLAPYVIRSVDFGSEPLFDYVLEPTALRDQVKALQKLIHPLGINVTISELKSGYYRQGDATFIFAVEDVVHAHQLPFFASDATDPAHALPSVLSTLQWFIKETKADRKVVFTETGWPSNRDEWKPNSPKAVASLAAEQAYADLLDKQCENFKKISPFGGVGWFWSIWSDSMLGGYGVLYANGTLKFPFAPRTHC